MADPYKYSDGVTASARKAVAVSPHDTNELTDLPKALYVGGAGNLVVVLADDSAAVTFTGVPAGSILPIRAKIVKTTNTTATAIVALC